MTKDEILKELIKKKVIRKQYDEYFIINKRDMSKDVRGVCQNLSKKYYGISAKTALTYFFNDAQIPAFQRSKDMEFALHTSNAKSLKIFSGIMLDNSIDFTKLVERTKNYYKSSKTVKKNMTNYFVDGLWKTVYDSYDKSVDTGNTKFL